MTASIILKKSSVAARVPATGDLAYGELALNYADGALYYKRSDNTVQNLVAVNAVTNVSGTGTVSGLTLTGNVTSTGSLTLGGTLTLTSGNVTTALGFTPYNATNPSGYTTNTGTVTSVATGTGLTGGTITTTGTIGLTGQALALHNLATNGVIARTGSGTVAARTITAGTAISVTNGNGVSGNPTITNTGVTSITATTPIVASASTGSVALSHANSGVTAGTYNSVTVNATGHVTGASNVSYLTGYTETDTLASVTARGNTTTSTITHGGLVPSAGTGIDQIYTVTDTLTLTTSWQDTSINAAELATGTYIVQVLANDFAVGGGQYAEYYSGIMSWHAPDTNATQVDEIALHRAGHAPNSGTIFLRTKRQVSGSTGLRLEIAGTTVNTGTSNYTFKFRRMI